MPQSSGNITVTNPKDIISNSLPTIASLQLQIIGYQFDALSGQWAGSIDDIVQVASMPVLLITQVRCPFRSGSALAP